MQQNKDICSHASIWPVNLPSENAKAVGYVPFSTQQRFTAATGSRKRVTLEYEARTGMFPLPLVLPKDELAYDPKYEPQSFSSWLNERDRNAVTPERSIVYVARYPKIGQNAPRDHHRKTTPQHWALPKRSITEDTHVFEHPAFDDVLLYLQAFFHGLPVKTLPGDLEIESWLEDNHQCTPKRRKGSKKCICELPEHIAITSRDDNVSTRVRVRHLHENESCSAYQTQLNLNDLLDHAIATLPRDAYCLLMLVDHDLYEDDDDDFCCGRAYGGSRIAVVSSAQYQPALDQWHGIDLSAGHNWPGSHCSDFVREACRHVPPAQTSDKARETKRMKAIRHQKDLQLQGCSATDAIVVDDSIMEDHSLLPDTAAPLKAALALHHRLRPSPASSTTSQNSTYLRRVGLTASHELLHCFGLDHCVHYACAMQGTSSIVEDSRQPPYLCPVCENKLAKAISSSFTRKAHADLRDLEWWNFRYIRDWKKGRMDAMLAFCRSRGDDDLAFEPFAAWLEAQMRI